MLHATHAAHGYSSKQFVLAITYVMQSMIGYHSNS